MFGNLKPWMAAHQAQSPLVQQPTQQPAAFQAPQVQWPQPNADMQYAQQLAQMYASQMPQQQVPGSAPLPTFQQPVQQAQPVSQQPLPQGEGWKNDWRVAKQDWRQSRPVGGAMDAWRAAKPDRGQFRGFGGQ